MKTKTQIARWLTEHTDDERQRLIGKLESYLGEIEQRIERKLLKAIDERIKLTVSSEMENVLVWVDYDVTMSWAGRSDTKNNQQEEQILYMASDYTKTLQQMYEFRTMYACYPRSNNYYYNSSYQTNAYYSRNTASCTANLKAYPARVAARARRGIEFVKDDIKAAVEDHTKPYENKRYELKWNHGVDYFFPNRRSKLRGPQLSTSYGYGYGSGYHNVASMPQLDGLPFGQKIFYVRFVGDKVKIGDTVIVYFNAQAATSDVSEGITRTDLIYVPVNAEKYDPTKLTREDLDAVINAMSTGCAILLVLTE